MDTGQHEEEGVGGVEEKNRDPEEEEEGDLRASERETRRRRERGNLKRGREPLSFSQVLEKLGIRGEGSASSATSDSWSESEDDDTVLDPDYKKDDSTDSISDEDRKDDHTDSSSDEDSANGSEEGGEETGAALEGPTVKRHKRQTPNLWKEQVIKEKRLKGEFYKNRKGQEKPPRTMGQPCTSQHCLKSMKRRCEELSGEDRTEIYNHFWSMSTWDTRKVYVRSLVDNVSG